MKDCICNTFNPQVGYRVVDAEGFFGTIMSFDYSLWPVEQRRANVKLETGGTWRYELFEIFPDSCSCLGSCDSSTCSCGS